MIIRGKSDLRIAYGAIEEVKEWIEEYTGNEGFDAKKAEKLIVKYKRDIREYYKRQSENEMCIVKDYGVDGYIELFQFPDYVKTEEEAKEFFEENCRLYCPCTIYDCTGKPFTEWEKIFKRNGKMMCYHRVGFDV